MINIIPKEIERASHISSRATAEQLNKELTPTLFKTIRSGNFPLYNYLIGCFVRKQLNVQIGNKISRRQKGGKK